MKKTILERIQSPVVWLAITAQVLNIVMLFAPQIADNFKIAVTSIVEILTLFGVLNNPTNREGF